MVRKSFIFLLMFILIMGCSTCYASMSVNEFKEAVENKTGVTFPDDWIYNSNLNTYLSCEPIIWFSEYTNQVFVVPNYYNLYGTNQPNFNIGLVNNELIFGINTSSKTYDSTIYYSSVRNFYYYFNGKQVTQNLDYSQTNYFQYYILDLLDFTDSLQYFTYGKRDGVFKLFNYGRGIGYSYSLVQDEISLEDYSSFENVEKFFRKSLIYTERDINYKGSVLDTSLFNGIFKGNETQEPYTSSFSADNFNLRFNYTAYTDLTNSNVVNYFYLQEFTPNEAVNMTNEELKFTDTDVEIVVNRKLNSSFSYTSLINRMEQGYIYRLYCFSNQHNESGDLIRTTDSTSCFFSLNSWKSNYIEVLNIYELVFADNPEIEQIPGGSTGSNLENIQNGIDDLNNNLTTVPDISGTTINSGDITGALDFDFMEDPYSNFWFELTTGLGSALTNNIRTLDINWLGYIHTIDLDTIGLKYPPGLELILTSVSTICIVWVLVKWWKVIIDKLTSGDMDEVLALNEEERYCRFILKG